MITVARTSKMSWENFQKHLDLRHADQFLSHYTQGLLRVLAAYHRRLHLTGAVSDHDHKDLETPK